MKGLARVPLTAALCALMGAACILPQAAAWLEFDRHAVAAGQVWRLLTCHLAHYGPAHLLWDAGVFAVLGALCEVRGRAGFAACTLGSALAIGAAVWLVEPGLSAYRGMSGVDSALLAMLAISILRDRPADQESLLAGAALALLAGFAAKVAFEVVTGSTAFVDSAAAGFVPVPLAHAVGGVAGAVGAIMAGGRRDAPAGPAPVRTDPPGPATLPRPETPPAPRSRTSPGSAAR